MAYEDADYMLRQFEARIDEQLAQADRLRTEMQSITATYESSDGAVTVTVDSSGGLADLRLTAAATRLGPTDLAGEIMACSRRAQAKLAERMGETVTGVLGPGSETAEYVTQAFTERFGSPGEGGPAGGGPTGGPAGGGRGQEDPDRYRDPYSEARWGNPRADGGRY